MAKGTRSPERSEFLSDIIITAVEGGTGYWAQVSQYQYCNDFSDHERIVGTTSVHVGGRNGHGTTATLHELLPDESGYEKEGMVLDAKQVARAVKKIVRGEAGVNDYVQSIVMNANDTNDAGMIDADIADAIAQIALLGEVRYG